MGGAAGGGGEYIEGTATGSFDIRINGFYASDGRVIYQVTPDSNGK